MMPSLLFSAFGAYCTSNVTNLLTSGPNIWFPIVMSVVLSVIAVVSVIYVLAPLMGRNDIRVWARAKVYDAMVTIVFALIFLSFSTALCSVPVSSFYESVGLAPNSCSGINDIYGLSLCDMYNFNQYTAYFGEAMYWVTIFGGLNPTIAPAIPVPGYPVDPVSGSGIGVSFQFALLPIVLVHQYIVPYMQAYFTAVLTSQLLQILLTSSMLLFSMFMTIGLIARSFGVTKSFGGAMIAFALGLGFIFPLMASMTYGLVDVAIENAVTYMHTSLPGLTAFILAGMVAIVPAIAGIGSMAQTFSNIFSPLIFYGGFIAAGLILIPLLNLVVVDAFIVDFSKAIGERMDLFSILTRII